MRLYSLLTTWLNFCSSAEEGGLTYHGESDIATIETSGPLYPDSYLPEDMFDGLVETPFYSSSNGWIEITFPTKITLGDIQLSQMPLNSDYNKARHYHGLCISIDERELGCVDGIYDEDYETYDDYAVSNILTFEHFNLNPIENRSGNTIRFYKDPSAEVSNLVISELYLKYCQETDSACDYSISGSCKITKDCPRYEECIDTNCECAKEYERIGEECIEIYSLAEEIAGLTQLDQLHQGASNCIAVLMDNNNIKKLFSVTSKFDFFNRATRKFLKKYHYIKFIVEKRKERSGDPCKCIQDAADAYVTFFNTLNIDMTPYNVQKRISSQGAKVKTILNKRGNCSL